MKKYIYFLSIFSLALLHSCNLSVKPNNPEKTSKDLNTFFDKVFEGEVSRKPQFQTRLGRKTNYDKWDDYSKTFHDMEMIFAKNILQSLEDSFNIKSLNIKDQLSYRLFKQKQEDIIKSDQYFKFKFWVNQMHGIQAILPAFLINKHKISSYKDATDYIKRIDNISIVLEQIKTNLHASADEGIIVPKFVFEHVINDSKNIIKGFPFKGNGNNTIFEDFKEKLYEIKFDQKDEIELISSISISLKKMFQAYSGFIVYLEELESQAPTNDGLWQYPNGAKYYQYTLQKHTTTDYTPEEIHQIGLSEVERIHNEMKGIISKVNFKGDLKSFFKYMKNENKFYYPSTEKGKADYIKEAQMIIGKMRDKLPEIFTVFPKAELKVKSVESFREKSAGKAFYEDPAPDGSRPGTFYVNTYNMKSIPIYQLEALAYHEGIPGHHMQIAIAQENESLPLFRKYGTVYTAYVEGWALYSEAFPKEFGFYSDPYSDFGRLAMELWRACRLVVDTGIHFKKWDRQKGIDYYLNNTPNDIGDCVKMVERHIVMPGQATSYKMGMLKILSLRKIAKQALGERFDIRAFHDLVLGSGPIPLSMLEENVNQWILNYPK